MPGTESCPRRRLVRVRRRPRPPAPAGGFFSLDLHLFSNAVRTSRLVGQAAREGYVEGAALPVVVAAEVQRALGLPELERPPGDLRRAGDGDVVLVVLTRGAAARAGRDADLQLALQARDRPGAEDRRARRIRRRRLDDTGELADADDAALAGAAGARRHVRAVDLLGDLADIRALEGDLALRCSESSACHDGCDRSGRDQEGDCAKVSHWCSFRTCGGLVRVLSLILVRRPTRAIVGSPLRATGNPQVDFVTFGSRSGRGTRPLFVRAGFRA